jgi:hypothetical protein
MKARHLGGDVTWRDGEIARLNAQVVRLDEQVARLRNERDAVRSALACVEDSASFKVGRALTAPPRALRDLLHPTAWSDRGADEYNSANEDRHV